MLRIVTDLRDDSEKPDGLAFIKIVSPSPRQSVDLLQRGPIRVFRLRKKKNTASTVFSSKLNSFSWFGIASALLAFNKTRIPNLTSSNSNMTNNNTKNEQLPLDLNDLITAVQGLPEDCREQLEQPLNRVIEYTRRRRRILNLIQEALSQLRMDMKYLMFDLEATRRERDSYKNALEGEI